MKRIHAYTGQKLTKFIYDGLYYPVIGDIYYENNKNKLVWSKKLGGWDGWLSWLPSIGIKCRVKNPKKPYKKKIIDAITDHKEMKISKWCIDGKNFMFVVKTTKNNHIGLIGDAYRICHLQALGTYRGNNDQICYGYDKHNDSACGWSHRAMVCFKNGDKLFDESFKATEDTLFVERGRKTIKTYNDKMQAALNFAHYVSK